MIKAIKALAEAKDAFIESGHEQLFISLFRNIDTTTKGKYQEAYIDAFSEKFVAPTGVKRKSVFIDPNPVESMVEGCDGCGDKKTISSVGGSLKTKPKTKEAVAPSDDEETGEEGEAAESTGAVEEATQKANGVLLTAENVLEQAPELDDLKKQAEAIGIKFHPNIKKETLAAKIAEELNKP